MLTEPTVANYCAIMRNIKAPFDNRTTDTVTRRHTVIERLLDVAGMFNKENVKYSRMHNINSA